MRPSAEPGAGASRPGRKEGSELGDERRRDRGARRPLGRAPWGLAAAGLAALLPAGAAAAPPGRWLLDHLVLDAAAAVAWRAGWVDGRHDGFLAGGGGGEVNMGLEFGDGYAVIGGARVLYGASNGKDAGVPTLSYLEASGQFGAQLRLSDWVRISAGAAAGRIWRGAPSSAAPAPAADGLSLVAGGFLRCGIDWLPRPNATLLRALSLWLRLDVSGHPRDDSGILPSSSMALGLGLGLRL